MIDLAILGVLKDHELHGYELRKRLGDLLGSRLAVSFGSIYPVLAKLEKVGYVKAVTSSTGALPSIPTSGSLTGELAAFRANPERLDTPRRSRRGKKVYGITPRGEQRLHELLVGADTTAGDGPAGGASIPSDRDFAVRVAFCHHLTAVERLALFERRRDELQQRREQRRAAASGDETSGSPRGQVNSYLRALLQHDMETVSADLAWLDDLIDAERAAVAATPHDTKGHYQP
jgi:DNA-binding PadR family transcriptional regulator